MFAKVLTARYLQLVNYMHMALNYEAIMPSYVTFIKQKLHAYGLGFGLTWYKINKMLNA